MTQQKVIRVSPTLRKLSNEQVAQVRIAHMLGESKASLSRRYSVSAHSVDNIIDHSTYKDA